jgi:cell division septum initiation protein DivIVA
MNHLKKENEELKREIMELKSRLNSLADSKKKYYENNKDIVKEKAVQRLKKIAEENPEKIKEYRRNAYLKRKEKLQKEKITEL